MPKKTLETVLESGNHLLVQLKGNPEVPPEFSLPRVT